MLDMKRREFITLLGGAGGVVATRGAGAASGKDAESRHCRRHAEIIPALGSVRATHG